jgi:kindlin 2
MANNNGSYSPQPVDLEVETLASSPPTLPPELRSRELRPKTLVERARLNVAWLDSSLSIMEQGIREWDTLALRFKFYAFFDLNPRVDGVRINQLYEQAKWQLLNEEIDCTEEEMLMFASLQLQVTLQSNVPQPEVGALVEDDIDAALNDLQMSLEGSSTSTSNVLRAPELSDTLRVMKPKKFTLKAFKKYHATCRDSYINFQRSRSDPESAFSISLRGSEATPDVNLSQSKFGLKLEVPGPEGMAEYWLRFDSESQYARWMAAVKLGSKGKSLADSSYESEVKTIQTFLAMQRRASTPAINPSSFDIQPGDFVAPRFLKRMKGKLTQRILEAHANVKDCNLIEAKMNYIKAWQSLPDFGLSLFSVKFTGAKREELLGVAFNRIMRMDLVTGDHLKTWRYSNMKAWNVNWEVRMMMIQLDDENISFSCNSADCKVVHEFIGGYIFLSLRSKDASQALNEELFHKLTGGWS